jgi:hypothetical protein
MDFTWLRRHRFAKGMPINVRLAMCSVPGRRPRFVLRAYSRGELPLVIPQSVSCSRHSKNFGPANHVVAVP